MRSEASDASTARRFARLSPGRTIADGFWELPEDGLCLSAFVILSPPGRPAEVLVGRIDPTAAWDRLGALDPIRLRAIAEGWMLPSSHLLYFESPTEAAHRVLVEQLGLEDVPLGPPQVYSEVYAPLSNPARAHHWDIDFFFRGVAPQPWTPVDPAWRELAFVEPSRTPRRAFTRSHDEVLELAGFAVE